MLKHKLVFFYVATKELISSFAEALLPAHRQDTVSARPASFRKLCTILSPSLLPSLSLFHLRGPLHRQAPQVQHQPWNLAAQTVFNYQQKVSKVVQNLNGSQKGYLAKFPSLLVHCFLEGHQRLFKVFELLHGFCILQDQIFQWRLGTKNTASQ